MRKGVTYSANSTRAAASFELELARRSVFEGTSFSMRRFRRSRVEGGKAETATVPIFSSDELR